MIPVVVVVGLVPLVFVVAMVLPTTLLLSSVYPLEFPVPFYVRVLTVHILVDIGLVGLGPLVLVVATILATILVRSPTCPLVVLRIDPVDQHRIEQRLAVVVVVLVVRSIMTSSG